MKVTSGAPGEEICLRQKGVNLVGVVKLKHETLMSLSLLVIP